MWRRDLDAGVHDPAALAGRISQEPITLYCGFDPTADSLHVGSMVPLLALRRFQLLGHHPIALAGGATGMIGDPGGRSEERNLLDSATLEHNFRRISDQLDRISRVDLVNNLDWTRDVSILDFLRL